MNAAPKNDNCRSNTPQLEKGYTRIASEWLEAFIMATYPAAVKDFVLCVVRETWGWNETWREIPMARFTDLLQVGQARVKQLRKIAVEHYLIEYVQGTGPSSKGTYRVQKDWTQWREIRLSGKWNKQASTGNNGLSGKNGLSGYNSLPATGKDGLSGNRVGRSTHLIDNDKHSKDNDSAPPAAAGAEQQPLLIPDDEQVHTQSDKKERTPTPQQLAGNTCLELWGIVYSDLDKQQAEKYYKAINKLISGMDGGAEELQAWAEGELRNGTRALGSGSKPEDSIPQTVRKEVTAKSWQSSFAAAKAEKANAGKLWRRCTDGSIEYEDTMEGYQIGSIRQAIAAGDWDIALGMPYTDDRHPLKIAWMELRRSDPASTMSYREYRNRYQQQGGATA